MSVIDSLTKGFQSVHRHWWVLLISVLLDVFLWIGPHASIEQLMQDTVRSLQTDMADLPTSAENAVDWREALNAIVTEVIPQYNGFSALRMGTLGVPSLMTWGGARLGSPSSYEAMWVTFVMIVNVPEMLISVQDATFVDAPVWQLPNEGMWLLLTLALTVGGVLIGAVYLASISYTVQQHGAFWARALRLSLRVALFWVIRFVLLIAAGVPLLMILLVIAAFSPGLASLFGTIVLGLFVWLSFYSVFFLAALAVNNVSILRALWNSFNVVTRNFWPTLGLFLLVNLIGGGLTILWQQLSTGSWLTLVGMIGNAYVGTGLVTASIFFYQDRYTQWQELLTKVRQHTGHLA